MAEGTEPSPGTVALVCCDKETRFLIHRATFVSVSTFAEAILAGDESENVMPLDSDRAPAESVQLLATWLRHHETVPPSKMIIPMPRRLKLDDLFDDPWDVEFLRSVVGPEEDMKKCKPLYGLALLSVYLQVTPLTEMLATFFAFKIRRGVRETGEPTKMVRQWFGKTGDYTMDEIKEMTEWVREACDGMEIPKRAMADVDDD